MLLRAREAAQFLRPRQRRAYQVFEEAKQGHLERECVEEVCSKEEAREVFENDPETVSGRRGLGMGACASQNPYFWVPQIPTPTLVQVQETRGLWNPKHLFWRFKDPCVGCHHVHPRTLRHRALFPTPLHFSILEPQFLR